MTILRTQAWERTLGAWRRGCARWRARQACVVHAAVDLAWLSSLFLVLRLPLLESALWHDEIYNTRLFLGALPRPLLTPLVEPGWAQGWAGDWLRQLAVHPPGVSAFYFVWIRLFGDSELSLHLPPLGAGLVSVWLTYAIGREIGDRWLAALAALALVVCSASQVFSTQAVHAPFEQAIYVASLWQLLCFWRAGQRRCLHRLWAFNLLGVLVFYHYLFFIAVQSAVLWWRRRQQPVPVAFFGVALVWLLGFSVLALTHTYAGGIDLSDWPANTLYQTGYNLVHMPHEFSR